MNRTRSILLQPFSSNHPHRNFGPTLTLGLIASISMTGCVKNDPGKVVDSSGTTESGTATPTTPIDSTTTPITPTSTAQPTSSTQSEPAQSTSTSSSSSSSTEDNSDSSSNADPFVPQAKILGVTFNDEGSRCPDVIAPSTEQAWYLYYSTTDDVPLGDRNCEVKIEMELPAGYSLSRPLITHMFESEGCPADDSSCYVAFKRTYWFENNPVQLTLKPTIDLRNDQENDWLAEYMHSPCSTDGKSHKVSLIAKLEAPAFDDSDPKSFGLNNIEILVSNTQVSWRKCNGGSVEIPPAGKNQPCGGLNKIQCAPGLSCEKSEEDVDGKCVDPNEDKPEESMIGGECGGPRKIKCSSAKDLICWYSEKSKADKGFTGRCRKSVASSRGEYCKGYPEVTCAEDLRCLPDEENKGSYTCQSTQEDEIECMHDSDCGADRFCEAWRCYVWGQAKVGDSCDVGTKGGEGACEHWLRCAPTSAGASKGTCKADKGCPKDTICRHRDLDTFCDKPEGKKRGVCALRP